ncbi:MAG: YybH family protein, partial [Gammaproteobacteria bacterium]
MEAVAYDVTPEDQLRDLIESWRKAAQAKDIDRIVSHYAPDILAFDAIAQLQFRGVDAYRKHWEACFAMCPGAMIFEIDDLAIEAGDDVAFAHGLTRCGVVKEDGEEQAGWMRMTAGYR